MFIIFVITASLNSSCCWVGQSQDWIREEGNANHHCYDTASLNSKITAAYSGGASPKEGDVDYFYNDRASLTRKYIRANGKKAFIEIRYPLPFDRQGKQGTVLADATTPDVLSCSESIYIWITWSATKLEFGKGNVIGEGVLVTYSWAAPTALYYMFIASGPQGDWGIPESLYPGQSNCIC